MRSADSDHSADSLRRQKLGKPQADAKRAQRARHEFVVFGPSSLQPARFPATGRAPLRDGASSFRTVLCFNVLNSHTAPMNRLTGVERPHYHCGAQRERANPTSRAYSCRMTRNGPGSFGKFLGESNAKGRYQFERTP